MSVEATFYFTIEEECIKAYRNDAVDADATAFNFEPVEVLGTHITWTSNIRFNEVDFNEEYDASKLPNDSETFLEGFDAWKADYLEKAQAYNDRIKEQADATAELAALKALGRYYFDLNPTPAA